MQDLLKYSGATEAKSENVFAQWICFLLTSKHEGFGGVVIEALQSGLPVMSNYNAPAAKNVKNQLEDGHEINEILKQYDTINATSELLNVWGFDN